MKRLLYLLVTLCLVLGILRVAVADVNHGHGPGYHAEEGHGAAEEGHGTAEEGHGTAEEGHGTAEAGHETAEEAHGTEPAGH